MLNNSNHVLFSGVYGGSDNDGVSLSGDEETVVPSWWGGRMLHPLSHIWGSGYSLIFGYLHPLWYLGIKALPDIWNPRLYFGIETEQETRHMVNCGANNLFNLHWDFLANLPRPLYWCCNSWTAPYKCLEAQTSANINSAFGVQFHVLPVWLIDSIIWSHVLSFGRSFCNLSLICQQYFPNCLLPIHKKLFYT